MIYIAEHIPKADLVAKMKAITENGSEQEKKFSETAALAFYLCGPEGLELIDYDYLEETQKAPVSFTTFRLMKEDAMGGTPTVTTGNGAIDTTVTPIKLKPRYSQFAGARVYHVDGKTYNRAIHGKSKKERFSKYIKDEHLLSDVREYAKLRPSSSIILKDDTTGAHCIFKRGSARAVFRR